MRAERRGRFAESVAALYLAAKFYRILGRRVKTRMGEIDLVALSPTGLLCFVEVKARAVEAAAAEAVGQRQRARIARAAASYCARHPHLAEKGTRFDIVTVAAGRWPRHWRDAWRTDMFSP